MVKVHIKRLFLHHTFIRKVLLMLEDVGYSINDNGNNTLSFTDIDAEYHDHLKETVLEVVGQGEANYLLAPKP
jgi:hypothetical protein